MKLFIEIDLATLPDGHTEPNELGVILGELRDWVEKLDDPKRDGSGRKNIRNFESQIIGYAQVR